MDTNNNTSLPDTLLPTADEPLVQPVEQDEPEEESYGLTFGAWLRAAGRRDSASQYNLRDAWRAGESPAEYLLED